MLEHLLSRLLHRLLCLLDFEVKYSLPCQRGKTAQMRQLTVAGVQIRRMCIENEEKQSCSPLPIGSIGHSTSYRKFVPGLVPFPRLRASSQGGTQMR